MNEVTVLLPAYNEEKNIEELVEKWQSYKDDLNTKYKLALKIIVVNDGSHDGTKQIGEKLEEKYDNFTLVNHNKNRGLGVAVETGIKYVIDDCPQSIFLCIMDCDNTHSPKYILDMLSKQNETDADVVIASRYQPKAEIKGVPKYRMLTCKGAKAIYSTILHVKGVKDYTCGYRLYKISALKKLDKRFKDKMIEESGFTCMAELLYKLYICGASFTEVPFELRYDFKRGASKMKVIKTSIDSLKLVIKLKKIKNEKNA